jgi:hypothetical protein
VSIPGYGKESVVRAIELADQEGLQAVVGIVDQNWTSVLYAKVESENLIYTDLYDLDATIVFVGGVFRRLVSSHCEREKVERHLERIGESDPLAIPRKIAEHIGVLRLVSQRDDLGLALRRFPVEAIVSRDCASVEVTKLVKVAVKRTSDPPVTEAELEQRLRSELEAPRDPARYCSGHDFFAAFGLVVRERWGRSGIGADQLARAARAALGCAELARTELFAGVRRWEERTGRRVWDCPLTARA